MIVHYTIQYFLITTPRIFTNAPTKSRRWRRILMLRDELIQVDKKLGEKMRLRSVITVRQRESELSWLPIPISWTSSTI